MQNISKTTADPSPNGTNENSIPEGADNASNSGLPNNETELTPESKEGFHKALTEKDRLLKEREAELSRLQEEKAKLTEAERQRKLAEMSDTERLQAELNQVRAEKYQLTIRDFVRNEVLKRNLQVDDPLLAIVINKPWDIPDVERYLGASSSWEEVQSIVEQKIPFYLDSLADRLKRNGTANNNMPVTPPTNEETVVPSTPVDTERGQGQPIKKRTWSQREIAQMDETTYAKYRQEINEALREGRIIP